MRRHRLENVSDIKRLRAGDASTKPVKFSTLALRRPASVNAS